MELVDIPDCESGGCGFDPRRSPQQLKRKCMELTVEKLQSIELGENETLLVTIDVTDLPTRIAHNKINNASEVLKRAFPNNKVLVVDNTIKVEKVKV